jgi:hypothetical protein
MLVEHVDQDTAVVAAVDRGPEHAPGVAADLAGEDDLDVVRAADVEVVGDQRLEEATSMARGIEDGFAFQTPVCSVTWLCATG